MMPMLRVKPYAFEARPRVRRNDRSSTSTNCRSLVQEYFDVRHGLFIPRVAVEMPGLWDRTGAFVDVQDGSTEHLVRLPHESILICERVTDAQDAPVDRSPRTFPDLDSYRMHLHTAVLVRHMDDCLDAVPRPKAEVPAGQPLILHASAAAGGTALWSVAELRQHYRVVAAKQLW